MKTVKELGRKDVTQTQMAQTRVRTQDLVTAMFIVQF